MTPARAKMARLPEGAEPLPNTVGAAPGVLLQEGDTLIACLPGVPAEMKDIFEHALWPRLAARLASGRQVYAERTIRPTAGTNPSWPRRWMRSRPAIRKSTSSPGRRSTAAAWPTFVTLAARAASEAETDRLLDAAEADLRQALAEVGDTGHSSENEQ